MKKEIFIELTEILDEEIKLYEQLRDLYLDKKKILIAAKPEDLGKIDEEIMVVYGNILNLDKKRTKLTEGLGIEEANMSKLIAYAEELDSELKEKLKKQKVKINEVSNELMLLNQRNVELIKHGLIITDRMLGTIVNAFAPKANLYDGTGKNLDNDSSNLSTVIEDV